VTDNPIKVSYLIVASFSDLEQANRMADECAGNYQADMFVLPPTAKGYYRVSYGKYSTTEEAQAALETIKQTAFPDAWLLTSK
jgi:septal ring-binding cell division protein DamX